MATQTKDSPQADRQRPEQPDLGPGHNAPSGKKSDPRGEGAQHDSSDPRGDLEKAEKQAGGQEDGFYNAGGDSGDDSETDTSSAYDPSQIKGREQFGDPNSLYNAGGDKSGRNSWLQQNKTKVLPFAGIFGGGVAGVIIALFMLIPLKIEHMITNLQERFFSAPQEAVEEASEQMMKHYVVRYVIPAYKDCGSTISSKCNVRIVGPHGNPVVNLYRSWAQPKLEHTLATKYGISFEFRPDSNTWYLHAPGLNSNGVDIGSDGTGLGHQYNSSREFRLAAQRAVAQETRWKNVFYRYKVGRLMTVKYGAKRCIVFCGTQSAVNRTLDEKRMAAKLYLNERVIMPRNVALGIVLECLFKNCDATTSTPTGDSSDPQLAGAPENPEVDTKIRVTLAELAAGYGHNDHDRLKRDYDKLNEQGLQKYLITEVLTKAGISAGLASGTASAIPIIGWINLAAQVVSAASDAGPNIRKFVYVVNITGAISLYMTYRTYGDEIHTGEVDAAEVGSFVDTLGPGDNGTPQDPAVGGIAGAEESPLYAELFNDSAGVGSASLLSALLPAKAHAAGASPNYKCDNGNPVPSGKHICDEEVFAGGNAIANAVSAFLARPGINVITLIANGWTSTFGAVLNYLGGVVSDVLQVALIPLNAACSLPSFAWGPAAPYCLAKEATEAAIPAITDAVTTALIPNPFGNGGNMSGGRKLHMLAAGAEGAGADYAHTGLGAQRVSHETVGDIYTRAQADARHEFSQKSLFARMFDTNSRYSLVSGIAMATPTDLHAGVRNSFASIVTNPFGLLANGLSSMFSGRADAAIGKPVTTGFGVIPYAYPEGAVPDNPEAYWDEHCDEKPGQGYQNDRDFAENNWHQAAANNLDRGGTEMPVNDTVNPCLLIKATVGAVGAKFDSSLLTDSDKAEIRGSASAAGGGAGAGTTPSGNAQELAKQLVDSGKITDEDGRYMAQIKAVANGDLSCNINPSILKMLVGVVVQDNHSLVISSLNRKCTNVLTASGPSSFHYADNGGHAVDVVGFDGASVTGRGSATVNFLNSASKYLPTNTGYGQVESCSSGFKIPAGSYAVPDSCNHQHIEVPKEQA